MKKILAFFLAMIVAYTPALVFASAAEKWDRLSLVYDAAGKVINVEHRKMILEAANDAVYKVKVPVTASATGITAASMIRLGLHGAAIAGVVYGMGWVIDEFGKVVKPPVPLKNPEDFPDKAYLYMASSNGKVLYSPTLNGMCSLIVSMNEAYHSYKIEGNASCLFYDDRPALVSSVGPRLVANPKYDPAANPKPEPQPVPVPDSELGQAIIDSPSAPDIIPAIYTPENPAVGQAPTPAPDAVSDALRAANPVPDSPPKGQTSPKPAEDTDGDGIPDTVPDGSEFQLPLFCSWAMAACEFFSVQKTDNDLIHKKQDEQIRNQEKQLEQDKTFFEKVEDWFDWSKDHADLSDSEAVEIEEPEEFDNSIFSTDRFSVSKQCPVPEVHTLNITGQTVSFSFDLAPLCSVLEFARPALVACSYLYAAYIVIGAARNG